VHVDGGVLEGVRAFLIDMDGTLYVGKSPVEGANEIITFLRERGYKFRIVTNATRRSRHSLCERLKGLGFEVSEAEIFSAPLATARYVTSKAKELEYEPKCFLLTTGDVHKDFDEVGVIITDKSPKFVVLGDAGDNFTYASLNKAFRFVLDGAELVAMEKDRYWMGSDGLMLGAGPFVAAVEYAAGVEAKLIGKPSRNFFELALRDMSVKAEEAAVIGDDVVSDVAGGKKLGMKGILVKTGKFRKEALERAEVKPDLILDSVAELRGFI